MSIIGNHAMNMAIMDTADSVMRGIGFAPTSTPPAVAMLAGADSVDLGSRAFAISPNVHTETHDWSNPAVGEFPDTAAFIAGPLGSMQSFTAPTYNQEGPIRKWSDVREMLAKHFDACMQRGTSIDEIRGVVLRNMEGPDDPVAKAVLEHLEKSAKTGTTPDKIAQVAILASPIIQQAR